MQVSKHLHLKFTQKPKMMKKTVLMLFIGLLSLGVYAQETAKIEFKSETIDYGEIERGSDGVRVFEFTNTGDAPLIITDAKSSCGCTVPNPPKDPIAPGEKGELLVKFNGSGQNQVTKTITVTANTAKGSEILRIKAFVQAPGATPAGPVK